MLRPLVWIHSAVDRTAVYIEVELRRTLPQSDEACHDMVEAAQRAETFATVIAPWSQGSFRASIGHCRRPVINPDTDGVQVWRIRARRWRKRPKQAVVVAPVGRTAAITSEVPTARAPPTRFPNPVKAMLTELSLV